MKRVVGRAIRGIQRITSDADQAGTIIRQPLWSKLQGLRSSWSLIDQAIVSGATFFSNVVLARHLVPAEYGVFAVLFGGMLGLQLFNATLVHHPLSVRMIGAGQDRGQLLRASLTFIAVLSIALSGLLAFSLLWLGYAALVLPAMAFFLCWQIQEGLRRGLLSLMRHQAACLGDFVSYVGQFAAISTLALTGKLSVANALAAMTLPVVAAALVQIAQLRLPLIGPLDLRGTAAGYWRIGGAWSLGNGLLSVVRVQFLPWTLAILHGPASAAAFQAAMNIINVSNPIVTSLCNIIPQATAEASAQGKAHAWRTARGYGLVALPPILLFAGFIIVAPELLLRAVYGVHSSYIELGPVVRLLIVAALPTIATELVISFLHGIVALRSAFAINVAGTASAVVLAIPMISMMGLTGGCLAILAASGVRIFLASILLSKEIGGKVALGEADLSLAPFPDPPAQHR